MLDIIPNALLQAFTFGIAAIGVAVAFRVVRYPDLTADGSFMLSSAVFAFSSGLGAGWPAALLWSVAAGASAGALTAVLNSSFGVSRLLSGILSSMAAYSIAFRLLGGRSNVSLGSQAELFSVPLQLEGTLTAMAFSLLVAGGFSLLAVLTVRGLLQSRLGLLLRATGENERVIVDLGRSPALYRFVGLAIANGLVALSAVLVSAQQGFVDINLGMGVVIVLVAALVLGEETFGRIFGWRPKLNARAFAPIIGTALYFALYLLILRATIDGWLPVSIVPTDLKLLSAILIVLVVIWRGRSGREQVLPI